MLVALFVLIAVAALAVGVLLIRQLGGLGNLPLFTKQGMASPAVVRQDDAHSRPLVSDGATVVALGPAGVR